MSTVANDTRGVGPEGTAVRVALWRAMHVQVDAPPHVLRDEIGIRLAAQPDERFSLPDMDPEFIKPFRASIRGDAATLRQVASLAPGSTFIMTFLMPLNLADPEVKSGVEKAEQGARSSGTPFISFYTPEEMLALARECGFKEAVHVSTALLAQRYFADRTRWPTPPEQRRRDPRRDDLGPPSGA